MLARLIILLPALALAHEVPVSATAQLWVRPAEGRLQLLLRVPLATLRDISFPEQPQGFLDIEKLDPLLPGAIKATILDGMALYQDGQRLPAPRLAATQISVLADRSFENFDRALAHIRQTKPPNSDRLLWNQVFLDLLAETPITSATGRFSLSTGFQRLAHGVTTILRFVPPNGEVRAWQWTADPGLVPLDPAWHQSAGRFLALGVEHILSGADHLLFVLCLVIPARRWQQLVWVVTAFTLAHSLTLIAAALGYAPGALWFPPLIETLIAASILYMAIENVWRPPSHRWQLAFAFGLIHGCGFAFALQESLQFAGSHLLLSLAAFNLGVELGQLAVLLVLVPALAWLLKRIDPRTGIITLSVLAGHTAWHWMVERAERLGQYAWPAIDLVMLLRIAAVILAACALWPLARKWKGHTG